MKYVLMILITNGVAPVTQETRVGMTAEFDDRAACVFALEQWHRSAVRSTLVGNCFPKGSQPAVSAAPAAKE